METLVTDPRLRQMIEEAIEKALGKRLPEVTTGSDSGIVTPIYPPLASVPKATRWLMARDYVLTWNLTGGQAPQALPLLISEPTMIYAVTAMGRIPATNAQLPLWQVEYQMVGDPERYNSAPALLGTIAGAEAGTPRLVAGRGWYAFDRLNLQAVVTNLYSDTVIRLDIVYHTLILRV